MTNPETETLSAEERLRICMQDARNRGWASIAPLLKLTKEALKEAESRGAEGKQAAIDKAVLDEREACQAIATRESNKCRDDHNGLGQYAANRIWRAIDRRSKGGA